MARRAEEIDWYVDLSERLERREHRRRWVILMVCVSVPLALMGAFVAYVLADSAGLFNKLRSALRGSPPPAEKVATTKELPVGPVSVAAFQRGDIRFPQLDNDGLMTTINHFFRELKPEKADVFTVNRETEDKGTILSYRLLNIGTGDTQEFTDVPVKRVGGEWVISEEGWNLIRTELQARMKVMLGKPTM